MAAPSRSSLTTRRQSRNGSDLTEKIHKTGRSYFTIGPRADIWAGRWNKRTENPKTLVIKVLRGADERSGAQILQSLKNEAMTWRRLSHKNVVQFLGIATGMGMLPAVILPRFKNGDIVSFIKSHPNCDRLKAIKDIARGLRYLHNFRPAVTHGNLKGSNVLVKEDGTACIVDFGLVFVLDEVDFTVASIAGPVRWMAPEVMMSEGPVYDYCLKADVYAFAMTVIEIISGKLPFTHIHSDSAVILRVIQGERPQYSQGDFVIPGLWQLLEECWKQEADERPNMNGALMHLENL